MRTRKDIILTRIKRDGIGLEIGPSHNPIAPKAEGFNVEVVDHAPKEELIEKYKRMGINTDRIEYVDHVWSGETYRELVGPTKNYDWIIASHVVEHVPDLVAFLNSCSDVLVEGGVLSLAVPDVRYCFDQFRSVSSLSSVIDASNQKLVRHSAGSIVEFFLNFSDKGNATTWDRWSWGENKLRNSYAVGMQRYQDALVSDKYIDIHKWCFTPSSFRLLIADLNRLGLIHLKEVEFEGTSSFEFFVSLVKTSEEPAEVDRQFLLESIQREMAEPMLESEFKKRVVGTLKKLARFVVRKLRAA